MKRKYQKRPEGEHESLPADHAERTTRLLERMARNCRGGCQLRGSRTCGVCACGTAKNLLEEMAVSRYRLGVVDVDTGKLECREPDQSVQAAKARARARAKQNNGRTDTRLEPRCLSRLVSETVERNRRMKDFTAYAVGLCKASVCTNLSDEEATQRLNTEHPTGISSTWEISKDKTFKSGEPNPCPCHDSPDTHRHILFDC